MISSADAIVQWRGAIIIGDRNVQLPLRVTQEKLVDERKRKSSEVVSTGNMWRRLKESVI